MINVTDYTLATRIELVQDDQPISWLTLNHLNIRVWGKTFTCGGIGGVGTKEEFRRKGYSRSVLDKSVEVMKDKGFHFSLLFGIPNFYYRWGFASCLPQNRVEIPTYQAERAPLTHEVEEMRPEDFHAIVEIFNDNNKCRTGSVVRDPEHFTKFRLGSHFGVRAQGYVLKKDGQIEGYLVLDQLDRKINAAEIEGRNISAYYSGMAFLAKLAVEKRTEQISANLPADHQFTLIARNYGATVAANYIYNADGMGRIITQEPVLKALEEDLYRNCGLDSETVSLVFSTDLGTTKLGAGKEAKVEIDQMALTQLIFGYRDPKSLIHEGRLKSDLSPETLTAMFPLRIAHLSGPDKF